MALWQFGSIFPSFSVENGDFQSTMQFSIVVKSSIGGSFLWSQKTHGTIVGIAFPSKVENWSPATKQNKNYWIWPKIGWVMGSFRPKFDFEKCIWRPSWITWPWMYVKGHQYFNFFESSMPLPCLCKVWSKFIEYFLIYIQLIVVVHILVKYLQTGHRVYGQTGKG